MTNRKVYRLEGLTCANCAGKIEKEVNSLPGVKEASINLMTSKLNLLSDDTSKEITTYISKIVKAHEPSVEVIDITTHTKAMDLEDSKEEKSLRIYFLRLVFAFLLTGAFYFLKLPNYMKLIGFIAAYILSGYDVLLTAGRNIIKGKVFDENFLMSIASLGAFIIGEQVEAVAVLIFYGVGELLQDLAVQRSRKNIANLMDIRPDYANLKVSDGIQVVEPELVKTDDIIVIKPGEKIPLDGAVMKGHSFIDSRAITGESVPVEVAMGDLVYSGTINTNGVLEVKVTKTFEEATVNKILELVQNASNKKAPSEKFITKFARYYTPIVVFLALSVALFPPLLGLGDFSVWIYRALSFLIISCPCALVISIPISFFGGIGGGAKHGILIKGGNYLNALNHVDTIVFDKTGTLTKGVFQVSEINPVKGVDKNELIRLAALAESHSNHPIAKSILSYYNGANNNGTVMEEVQITEIAGQGIVAQTKEGIIYAGNEKLLTSHGINLNPIDTTASIIYIAIQNKYMGYILISDEIKSEVKAVIASLKRLGVKHMVMLTGDQQGKAKEIANACNIDEYYAQLLPQDKVEWLERIKKKRSGNGKIVFVGDGINDAPVLAGADIGIAMGAIGSDAAIEAADVVIMNDDIGKIATAIKIARKTRNIVTLNIIFALGVKILVMLLAFFGITSIWFAIFADVGVAFIAILNAMRAMYIKS